MSEPASCTSSPSAARAPDAQPIELTPRSKVKAMLQALDEDSDKENQTHDGSRAFTPAVSREHRLQINGSTSPPQHDLHPQSDPANRQSDSPIRRKGTLAARMQGESHALEDESDAQSEDNAYERVKMRLFAGKEGRTLSEDENSEVKEQTSANFQDLDDSFADSEREDPPALSRGVKRRLQTKETTSSASITQSPAANDGPLFPGLFISPQRGKELDYGDRPEPESSTVESSKLGNRFRALLERKRKEGKLARDSTKDSSEEEEENDELQMPVTTRPTKIRKNVVRVESESDGEKDAGKKFTQEARPTRKASKKALEEMNRETQRMSRNMQLAHEARTKTKYSKEGLFAKFNFRQTAIPPVQSVHSSSSSTPGTPGAQREAETPPSSPPSTGKSPQKVDAPGTLSGNNLDAEDTHNNMGSIADVGSEDEDLPDLHTLLSHKSGIPDPSYLGGTKPSPSLNDVARAFQPVTARQFAKSAKASTTKSDSDDDLDIVLQDKPARLAVFNLLPEAKKKESHSLHALRALAQLHDTEKSKDKKRKSMTSSELQVSLHRRAKEQGKRERDEKLERLKSKGVVVQTAEEKEKDQMQLENMLDRARKEAEQIAKKEKEMAEKDGKGSNEESHLPDSDDEDEDYKESENDAEEAHNQLSGSDEEGIVNEEDSDLENVDDEEEEEEVEDEDEDMVEDHNALVDGEAAEDDDEKEEGTEQEEDEESLFPDANDKDAGIEADEGFVKPKPVGTKRKIVVLSDDEDEEDIQLTMQTTPMPPPKVLTTPKSATAQAFGFDSGKFRAIGLSQVFAGTMAESQLEGDETSQLDGKAQAPLDFLRALEIPEASFDVPQREMESPSPIVQDSQKQQPIILTSDSDERVPSGLAGLDSPARVVFGETPASQMPEPTQDVGFEVADSQVRHLAASYSTVDTVIVDQQSAPDSPSSKKKGRLRRKTEIETMREDWSDINIGGSQDNDADVDNPVDVFEIMRVRSKKTQTVDALNKKKSEAKEMFEEQAEESEDEYAGLGGVSDDDSGAELDEEVKQIIDDDDTARTNERDIAAFYAEKERAEDEKGVEKLYHDIVNGGLRRKRGAEHDIWDSDDDEEEVAARRRAAKQREFARQRRALLADEKLGKIAENPKQQAFFQTIEDRADLEHLGFLNGSHDQVSQVTDSQNASVDSRRTSTVSLHASKRSYAEYSQDVQDSQVEQRPPSHLRRTNKSTRPTSLAEIRNTLSEIITEPQSILESQICDSPTQSGDEDATNSEIEYDQLLESRDVSPPKPSQRIEARRSTANAARAAVIDRMAIKRAASTSMTTSIATSGDRPAFQAPSKSASTGFRVPSLLRRATTASNASSMSESDRSTSTTSGSDGGFGGKDLVKMGGTKKSSVNYYVRERERKAKLEKVEQDRMEGRVKVAKMRRNGLGLDALVNGTFG